AGLVAAHFPWASDEPQTPTALLEDAESFYEAAYRDAGGEGAGDSRYVQVARNAAHHADVRTKLERFVAERGLEGAKALEVGAGSGTLQDVIEDYTGLDIAASARRYFHKPFVHGSATELPFADGTFDLVFSIWTYEHVPNPG